MLLRNFHFFALDPSNVYQMMGDRHLARCRHGTRYTGLARIPLRAAPINRANDSATTAFLSLAYPTLWTVFAAILSDSHTITIAAFPMPDASNNQGCSAMLPNLLVNSGQWDAFQQIVVLFSQVDFLTMIKHDTSCHSCSCRGIRRGRGAAIITFLVSRRQAHGRAYIHRLTSRIATQQRNERASSKIPSVRPIHSVQGAHAHTRTHTFS